MVEGVKKVDRFELKMPKDVETAYRRKFCFGNGVDYYPMAVANPNNDASVILDGYDDDPKFAKISTLLSQFNGETDGKWEMCSRPVYTLKSGERIFPDLPYQLVFKDSEKIEDVLSFGAIPGGLLVSQVRPSSNGLLDYLVDLSKLAGIPRIYALQAEEIKDFRFKGKELDSDSKTTQFDDYNSALKQRGFMSDSKKGLYTLLIK